MARKSNSLTQDQVLQGAWHIKGRGKRAEYFAKLPAMLGNPGGKVQLTSQAGVITTGTLVEVHERTDDGFECWTFVRDQKSPEQLAADRALKLQHNAEYWASDKGQETARKIRERQERKAQSTDQVQQDASTSTPDRPTATSHTATSNVDVKALALALKEAGFGPLEVAKAIMEATSNQPTVTTPTSTPDQAPEPTPTPVKRGPGRPKGSTNKPTVASTATIKGNRSGGCVSCGKRTSVLHKHVKGNVDGVCITCMSLDAETVRANAVKRMTSAK